MQSKSVRQVLLVESSNLLQVVSIISICLFATSQSFVANFIEAVAKTGEKLKPKTK
jgi:hypothetical protein